MITDPRVFEDAYLPRELMHREGAVEDSFERAQHHIRQANLRLLPVHHHALYALIHDAGEISATDLHARYEELSERVYYGHDLTPIGRRSRRNKLAKLQEYDLIEHEGPPQNRVYSVLDDDIDPPVDDLDISQHAAE